MDLSNVINAITPLYNEYKEKKDDLPAYQSIGIMWEIGSILSVFIHENDIKPHTLYRMIYGKSEGSSNIKQKSYITREFQGRCVRIKSIFETKEEIENQFLELNSFTNFRECMPFFDNPKYMLKGDERVVLLELLNSNLKPSEILKKIRQLQKQKIGIKNTRTQRLKDLENEKKVFIDFYNFIYRLLDENDFSSATNNINSDYYLALYNNTMALCQDGLKYQEFTIPDNILEIETQYGEIIKFFTSKKTPKEVRRFRKIIPIERISRLAEMIYALTNEDSYSYFK